MKTDLRARLLAGLAPLVGNRVDWINRPQGKDLPAVTSKRVSPGRDYHHGGADGLHESRIQIDCWGATQKAAEDLSQAVIAIVEAPATEGSTQFSSGFLDGATDFDPESIGGVQTYRVSLDFMIWWGPAS